jgi:hypothetical protein
MVLFGAVGYLMRKFGYEPVPLVLAFALGPLLENNLRKDSFAWGFHDLHRSADLCDLPRTGGGRPGRAGATLARAAAQNAGARSAVAASLHQDGVTWCQAASARSGDGRLPCCRRG